MSGALVCVMGKVVLIRIMILFKRLNGMKASLEPQARLRSTVSAVATV
jgi:hypothetical protein